jgi:hypothetical protein
MRVLIAFFALLFIAVYGYSQDSLVMYNGKYLLGKVTDLKDSTIVVCEYQKRNKSFSKLISKEAVFSVHYKDSASQYFYFEGMDSDSPASLADMTAFVEGEQIARYKYHPRWAIPVGVLAGIGGTGLGIYGLLVPAAYVGTTAALPVGGKHRKYFPEERVNDVAFMEGYKREAKRKRLVNTIIGSVSGILITGITIGVLTSMDMKKW